MIFAKSNPPTRALVCAAAILSMTACRSKPQRENGVSSEEGNVAHVNLDDSGMNAAIADAKRTSGAFLHALHDRKPGTRDFSLKKPFKTADGVEHLWIVGIAEVGDHLEGEVGNDPESTREVKFRQHVSLNLSEISDWKYIENNKLVGGYTIRYQISKMSAADKKALADQLDYTVE